MYFISFSCDSEGCNENCDMVYKSIKIRWGNVLRHVLPVKELPISALWRCRIGSSESYALGSCKSYLDMETEYILCDIREINFEKLTASADVFYPEDKDATHIPNIYLHELSLVNMNSNEDSPQKSDIDTVLTKDEIQFANMYLDHLRFFYNIVWFPWDERLEDEMENLYDITSSGEDWVSRHLENRIKAYKDSIENDNDIYEQLKNLAYKHDQLINRQVNIAPFYENDKDGNDKDDLIMVEVHEIEDELDNIKKQAERIENPSLRKAFQNVARLRKIDARKAMLSDYTRIGQNTKPQVICLVIGKFTNLKGMTDFMFTAQKKVGFDMKLAHVIYRDNLQLAIHDMLPGDIIVLPPGDHVIKDWGDMKKGGSIYGVDASNPSLIELHTLPGQYGMEISNGAVFENVIISSNQFENNNGLSTNEITSLNDSQTMDFSRQPSVGRHGLLIQSGAVQMTNCTLLGLECAIRVKSSAELSMNKCKLNLNEIGILAEKAAGKITLNEVIFEGNAESDMAEHGIVIFEDMSGQNFFFDNVSLRYPYGHFVFVDPGFFAKKSKKNTVLYFKDSWDDVRPLLSKSVKTNLCLETSLATKDNCKLLENKGCQLLVVENFTIGHNGNMILKLMTNPKISVDPALEENIENGSGDTETGSQSIIEKNDVYVTSSGNILTPNIKGVVGDC